jgi:hypothetical protein
MAERTEELIAALASGQSYEDAAQSVGLCKRTVVRKMKNAAFRRKVREARSTVLEQALSNLAQGATEASIVLRHLLLHGKTDRLKLAAAKALLHAEARFRESEDMAADIEDLKQQVAKLQHIEKRRQDYERRPSRN